MLTFDTSITEAETGLEPAFSAYEAGLEPSPVYSAVRRVGVEPTMGFRPPVSETGALPFCYQRAAHQGVGPCEATFGASPDPGS